MANEVVEVEEQEERLLSDSIEEPDGAFSDLGRPPVRAALQMVEACVHAVLR